MKTNALAGDVFCTQVLNMGEGEKDWQVEVFFDGDCPLCVREIRMLKKLDKKHQIRFNDIALPEFTPPHGFDMAALNAEIHGRLPDGTWIKGVEVFRRLYAAVGFTSLVAMSRLAGISHLLDAGYKVFARNRLKWTGRCEVDASGTCSIEAV